MELVNLLAALLGVVGAIFGGASWFAAAVKKSYAAEREFLHIRGLINEGYADIDRELGILSGRVERIELLLIEIASKIEIVSNRNRGSGA